MANTVEVIIKGIDATGAGFGGAIRRMNDVGKAATSMFAVFAGGAAIGAVGSLVALTENSIKAADEMGKLAQKAGLPVEQFSQLAHAAHLANVSNETLVKGFKALSEEMVKQGRGGEALLPQLLAQADVFKRMEDGANKTALAVQLFGKSGQDLIPLLNQGSDALRETMREADRLGLTVSAKFAADANEFEDNLFKMKASLVGVGNELAKTVLPELKHFSEWVLESHAIPIFFDTVTNSIKDLTGGLKALITAAASLPQGFTAPGSGGGPKFYNPNLPPGSLTPDQQLLANTSQARAFLAVMQGPGSSDFIGPPMPQLGPPMATGGGGARAAAIPTPLTPGAREMLDEWEKRHAEALMRARELENQFNAETIEHGTSKAEQEAFHYNQSMAQIDNEYQTRLSNIAKLRLDEDEAIALSNAAWEAHHAKLQQLERETAQQRQLAVAESVGMSAQILGSLSQIAATQGRKQFALTQGLRYGETVMHGASAIIRAWADPGWPLAIGLTAVIAAQTAAQLAVIASQKPPQAHGGASFIPEEATYLLKRGERVLSPGQNADFTSMIQGGGMGGQSIHLHIGTHQVASWFFDGSRNGEIALHPRAVREQI